MDDETRAKKSSSDGEKPKRARRKSRIAGYRPRPKIRTARPARETPAAPPEAKTPVDPPEEKTPVASPKEETPAARPKRRPRPARPRPRLRGTRPKPKIRVRTEGETPAAQAGAETSTDRPKKKTRPVRPKRKRPVRKRPLRKRPIRKKKRKKAPSYEDLKDDAVLDGLRAQFPDEILSGQSFLGQSIYTVTPAVLYDVMLALRDHSKSPFDYLIDVSALDYLGDQERFLMVYHLYSYATKKLVRVKSRFKEGDPVPSMTSIWKTADWLEREVYDMFGILFSGHPDLKRILLPDDWHGFPLRKDYDIKLQDQSWIRNHLTIRKTPD